MILWDLGRHRNLYLIPNGLMTECCHGNREAFDRTKSLGVFTLDRNRFFFPVYLLTATRKAEASLRLHSQLGEGGAIHSALNEERKERMKGFAVCPNCAGSSKKWVTGYGRNYVPSKCIC